METLKQWAIKYAQMGYKIFPCVPKGKMPATKSGYKDATNNLEQIHRWWDSEPEYNIGLPTGEINQIVVVDCDIHPDMNEDGYRDLCDFADENGEIPDTVLSITQSGGYHFIFKTDKAYKNRVRVYGSIDIRGNGGYIVVPPSVGELGEYCWECGYEIDEFEMAEANEVIDKLINLKKESVLTEGLPAELGEGKRNDLLFKEGCRLRSSGYRLEEIEVALSAINSSRCSPPLSAHEVKVIAESCSKYEAGKKINVSLAKADDLADTQNLVLDHGKGGLKQTIANATTLLKCTPTLANCIGFNELTGTIYCMDYMPWDKTGNSYREWRNSDYPFLYEYMEGLGYYKKENIDHALSNVAHSNRFNPITEMLDSIYVNYGTCTGYVDRLLPKYMGVKDTQYQRNVMRTFMLGAVARAYQPGIKFDYMLVFTGKQGAGKSTFFRRLAMDDRFYNENLSVAGGDKAIEKIRGMWICELAELAAMKKAKDMESIKAFITTLTDNYRAPYEKVTETRPRRCVLVGTTNAIEFLTDNTGNRRFLVVEVDKDAVSKETRDMLVSGECLDDFKRAWGEIVAIYKSGNYSLMLDEDSQKEAETMQENFADVDPLESIVLNWLDTHKPDKMCATMVLKEAFCIDLLLATSDRQRVRNVNTIIGQTGLYERASVRLNNPYGVVRGWKRKEEFAEADVENLPFD